MPLSEDYVQSLIALQTRLYAFLMTLLADSSAADDVLQETNLVLCRKSDSFTPGTDFEAWAFHIARVQCLAYWKIRQRDRVVIDEAVLTQVASRAEGQTADTDARIQALRRCLAQLPPRQRALVESRYADKGSVKTIAGQLGRSASSISQTLYRIRAALLNCIRTRIAAEQHP